MVDSTRTSKIVLTAEDQTRAAIASAQRNLGQLDERVIGLRSSFGALFGALSVGSVVAFVKSGVDAVAMLDDLSERTSLSVETLDSLSQVAKIGGHDLEGVATMASKFAKSVAEAAGGNETLMRSFRALGISQQDLKNKKFDELFVDFANKIAKAENRTYAIAHATDLAGRSAATAIPFFRDLAEHGLAQARVTEQQAAQAEALQKAWNRLGLEVEGLQITLGNLVAGPLTDWLEANREAIRIAGGLGEALRLFVFSLEGMSSEEPGEQLRRLNRELLELKGTLAGDWWRQGAGEFFFGEQKAADLEKQIEFLKVLQRQQALALSGPGAEDPRDILARRGMSGFDLGAPVDPAAEAKARAAAEKAAAERKRMQELDARGWATYVDAMTAEYEDGLREQMRLTEDFYAERDRLLKQHQAGEIEAIEAQIDEYEESLRATNLTVNEGKSFLEAQEAAARKARDGWKDLGLVMSSAFEEAIVSGQGLREVLQGIAQDIARIILREMVTKPIAGFLTGIIGSFLGFQHGGEFTVGGSGGPDSKLVQFAASPGERVTITPPGQESRAGGDTISITMNQSFGSDVNRGTLIAWGEQVKRQTIAAVAEHRKRGGQWSSAFIAS